MAAKPRINFLDRSILAIAPSWGLSRIQARAIANTMARHYDAASGGRRTQHWPRRLSDANTALAGALPTLRAHSRDLVRNDGWARNSVRVITRNVVGYGITPKAKGLSNPKRLMEAWDRWAGSTQCDAAGRFTFSGIQKLAMRSIVEGGEVLVRRRWRRPTDGLDLPLQFEVLEPDFIDTSRTNIPGQQGGRVIHGIEFDAIGRRVAYWLFDWHPGSAYWATPASSPVSHRVPASEVIHVYDVERAGQDRGLPWLASAIVTLKDLSEHDGAQLLRQKIAQYLVAFRTGVDPGSPFGAPTATDPIDDLEPGSVIDLAPGQDVKFSAPPPTSDDGFSQRTLRKIAAAVGVTYEDLTGDYSQVNFSSARMSRIAHWGNVYDWQWNMLIPQLCDRAWAWAMDAAAIAGLIRETERPRAEWTPQPMPLTEPDREARANVLMIRSGQKTLSQVIREQGGDPEMHLAEYAADMKKLDDLGIWLDSDVRRVSQAGLTQARPGATGFNDEAKDAVEIAEELAAQGPAREPVPGDVEEETETEQPTE